jgi:5'-nucleotidase
MNILLTNDDGLLAPGLIALHQALKSGLPGASITTVAPAQVQSATSHCVTFHAPLMVRELEVQGLFHGTAVEGKPADCVKLALSTLWPDRFGRGSRPDLLISGMNAGANCGINVLYSGTVAAALEGALFGVPAIAVSLHLGGGSPLFDLAASHATEVIRGLLERALKPGSCLSINVPRTEQPVERPPVRVCPVNRPALVDRYESRSSPGGQRYYWSSAGAFEFREVEADSDVDLLFEHNITVTPLQFDLTDHAHCEVLRDQWSK